MAGKAWETIFRTTITKFLRFGKNADGIKVENDDGTTTTVSRSEIAVLQGITATAAEINAAADVSGRVTFLDATSLSITAATHGERIVTLSHTAAESTVTLPAATGTGNKYTFIVAAVNTNNHKIQVANATDVFEGLALIAQDSADTIVAFETAAGSDTITLNGTTKGGAAIGDKIEFIDYASGKFQINAVLTGTGTEATPFSAAVS